MDEDDIFPVDGADASGGDVSTVPSLFDCFVEEAAEEHLEKEEEERPPFWVIVEQAN